jgi:hypothetical protein
VSKLYQLQHVEQMAATHDELKEPIGRWLEGKLIPSDRDLMISMIDHLLPDDQILWPPYVMVNINEGHITISGYVLDITAKA